MEITGQISALEDDVNLLKGEVKSILEEIRTTLLDRDNPFSPQVQANLEAVKAIVAERESVLMSPANMPVFQPAPRPGTEEEPAAAPEQASAGPSLPPGAPPPPPTATGPTTPPAPLPPPTAEGPTTPLGPVPPPAGEGPTTPPGPVPAPSTGEQMNETVPQAQPPADPAEAAGGPQPSPAPQRAAAAPTGSAAPARSTAEETEPEPWSVSTIAGLVAWIDETTSRMGPTHLHIILDLARFGGVLPPEAEDVLLKVIKLATGRKDSNAPSVSDILLALRQLEAILQGEDADELSLMRRRRAAGGKR